MKDDYEEVAKGIARAQAALAREEAAGQKPASTFSLNTVFDRAPAWITLLAAVVVAYASLNTRVSTCEYQNQISIADRTDLHRRLDKTGDTLAEVRTALGEIKVTLKELAERRR